MREGIRVREITNDEGRRLLQIVRRSSGSVVRWRRAQMVLLSAQGMDVAQIAKVAFTSPDRVREVLHNFNDDGFDSLAPKYAGGRPPEIHPPRAQGDQEDRPQPSGRSRPALFHLELVQAGRVPRRRGGGRRHQSRGSPRAPPRGGCLLSSDQDLEAIDRPRLRGQEEPGARALRHRRRQGETEEGRPDCRDLHGRVRPAQLASPPRKAVGAHDRQS